MSGFVPYLYNSETEEYDKLHGHHLRELLPSEADTESDRVTGDIENPNAQGLFLHVNLSNVEGGPGYVPAVEVKTFGDTYVEIFTANSALGNAGNHLFVLYPGVDYSGGDELAESASIVIPRRIRVRLKAETADGSNRADTLVTGGLLH